MLESPTRWQPRFILWGPLLLQVTPRRAHSRCRAASKMRWLKRFTAGRVALALSLLALTQTPVAAGGFQSAIRYFGAGALFADGTAAAPSISFINDTDTGLYRVGANILGFAAGGANVGRADGAAGRWAFGPSSLVSQATVEIKGVGASAPQLKLTQDNVTDDGWIFNADGNGGHMMIQRRTGAATTDKLKFNTDGSLRYYGPNASGSGSAALGSNSPATVNTAPFVWITSQASDGSTI